MYVCARMACVCVQNACREARGQLQMSFLKYRAWNSSCSLGWLASKHKGSPCLCLLSTEIISLSPPCLAGFVF